jgi:DNA-binding PadR family transcriptional regulator
MNNINDLDISLLGFLSSKPMHGYELHKQVTDLSGFGIVWNIKIGKLYAMLNRLEKDGYVRLKISREGNRPARNEFSITSNGMKKYKSWLISPINRGREFRIIFLLKLYFSLGIGLEHANELITTQIETCNSWLSDRKARNEDIEKVKTENKFPVLVNKYRQIQIQGYLAWLDWCRESLSKG